MSGTVEFHEVTSDEEASFLLPDGDDALHVVLFCEPGSPTVQKACELAPEVDIPEDWNLVRLDTEGARRTARHFGVAELEGMAVVENGTILDVEYECSLEAFRRLIEVAKRQSEALDELG
ncbi:MAG: hypothetical protein ABEN55_17980 [Bradymonadaceae bacterium]